MATHWVKSCKSASSANDVVVSLQLHHKPPKHRPLAVPSSCRKGVQSLKDVVVDNTTKPTKKKHRQPSSVVAPEPGPKRDHKTTLLQTVTVSGPLSSPALTELPLGHPSRNVVEMIFLSGWQPEPFPGRVEIVFKVRNTPGTASRFEEYREKVKARAVAGAGGDHARCAADGNEVMGFHCLGPADGKGLGYDGAWGSGGQKGAVCVFSGGGEAHHQSGGGGGKGRRAMLVCRVIAGRVCKRVSLKTSLSEGRVGFDSVSGEKGELVVCDTRAVLPCFLILYES